MHVRALDAAARVMSDGESAEPDATMLTATSP